MRTFQRSEVLKHACMCGRAADGRYAVEPQATVDRYGK